MKNSDDRVHYKMQVLPAVNLLETFMPQQIVDDVNDYIDEYRQSKDKKSLANNLVGQTITQTVNVGLGHEASTANVEAVLQLQEGETTVYQLILNVASIDGTFVSGAEVTGIDLKDSSIENWNKINSL